MHLVDLVDKDTRVQMRISLPNKQDAVNVAIAPLFHAGRRWRGVADLKTEANEIVSMVVASIKTARSRK